MLNQSILKQQQKNITIKLGNMKSTGGKVKITTLEGYIKPTQENQISYKQEIRVFERQIKQHLKDYLKDKTRNKIFNPNTNLIIDSSIRNYGLKNPNKYELGTFFTVEYYLVLKDDSLLKKRSIVASELMSVASGLVSEVFEGCEEFVF